MRSVRAQLVVQSLCVWNGSVLVLVGVLFAVFGGRPGGLVVAVACWAGALVLLGVSRRVGRAAGWG